MFMVSDFTACQAVATDQQPYRRSKRRRKRRHRHYSDDEVDQLDDSKRRKPPAIVCPQSDFQALLQQHDELDRVFSESCLTVLNLLDLLGDERNGYHARPHETSKTIALVKDNDESTTDESNGCSDQDANTTRSMLRCFAALWFQVSGGETTDCFLRPPNRLYSTRRDVLAVALAFRFSVRGSPFAVHTRSLLATYRERLDLIVECVHMADCKRTTHDCCDITYSADTVTVSLSNEIVEKAIRVVREMDATPTTQQQPTTLELMQTISKQLWQHITEFWLARLALSTYVHDYAKRLNSRLTRLVKQLFRIAGLPPVFLTTNVIQLYVTMFVRTFEVCRQVETNTWRLLYARQEPESSRQFVPEGDDRLEDRLDNNADVEFADEMDQQLQSVEEDRLQCRVRRFVAGYVYYLTGGRSGVPTNRLATARVASVNLDAQNDCRELIALNETVMDVFLTLRALYFEPQTARHDRFVASLNRVYRVEHSLNVELRDRKSMLALPSIQNPIDLFELDFLVRKIREIVDRYRCDEPANVDSPTNRVADCDDANALMSIIESDVNRLNDQNFRLKERGWDQCDGWIFTRDDFWKYTYVYALLSNVTDTECLREIRQLISMFDQLLRVKLYRLLFVPVGSAAEAVAQPQPMEGVEFDDAPQQPVMHNLADIYDNVETNMRTQRDYLNGVYGTLDSINRLTSAR